MGRPTKFTPEACEIILDAIEKGNFLVTAGRVAGVGRTTLKRWLELGKSRSPEHTEFRAFRTAVRRARARAEAESVEAVRSDKTWTAKAWFLERSFRERWGPVSKIKAEVTGKDGAPLAVAASLSALPTDDLLTLRAIAGKLADARPDGDPTGD